MDFKKHVEKSYEGVTIDSEKGDAGCINSFAPVSENESIRYFIWVRLCEDIAVLVHECIHLAYRVLEDRGIKISQENDEVLAYYHGYLFKTLWNEMTIHTDKKAKRKAKKGGK
jgi:hypothetical protein